MADQLMTADKVRLKSKINVLPKADFAGCGVGNTRVTGSADLIRNWLKRCQPGQPGQPGCFTLNFYLQFKTGANLYAA